MAGFHPILPRPGPTIAVIGFQGQNPGHGSRIATKLDNVCGGPWVGRRHASGNQSVEPKHGGNVAWGRGSPFSIHVAV